MHDATVVNSLSFIIKDFLCYYLSLHRFSKEQNKSKVLTNRLAIICSKLTIETLEQGVKHV